MAKLGQAKPSVPVFVSSTFTDMQEYRRKVQDALTQLETIVRGMEQFGSKPGSPVEECLRVVGSCMVYLGIFGMRYGSIPDGHESSMTHLEYDEAQKLSLPSLIYLLDENQPIPAKDVETGIGAEKLRELKEHLKRRHVVSFYTTPEDLQARILHDVPTLLKDLGADVAPAPSTEPSDAELLEQFLILPKLFRRRSVTCDFVNDKFEAAPEGTCEALDLDIGATVRSYNKPSGAGRNMYLYGEGDMAVSLMRLPKGTKVRVRAETAFGVEQDVRFHDDGTLVRKDSVIGLVIKEILGTDSTMAQ